MASSAGAGESERAWQAGAIAEHNALNARVERVAHRLLTANAELCGTVRPVTGMRVHTLEDYPEAMREVAGRELGLGRGVHVRSVVRGGPADAAGVEAGDMVSGLGGVPVTATGAAREVWRSQLSRDLRDGEVSLELLRGGEAVEARVEAVPACAYPVDVVLSDVPNAHTDGARLGVTSEMVRQTESDARLALVLAHELAHALVHPGVANSPAIELEADALGLLLVARAGWDMDVAVAETEAFGRRYRERGRSGTHPRRAERNAGLLAAKRVIEERMLAGERLTLELLTPDGLE